jgi:hypothetical protein
MIPPSRQNNLKMPSAPTRQGTHENRAYRIGEMKIAETGIWPVLYYGRTRQGIFKPARLNPKLQAG